MKRFKITFAFRKAEPGNLNPATSIQQLQKLEVAPAKIGGVK